MSAAFPVSSTPGIYRLVSPVLTTGVKTGSLNDNVTFNTNIPSLDYAIRIWRIRHLNGFPATVQYGAAAYNIDAQYFTQLTENQTKTTILGTDTSYLDSFWQHVWVDQEVATAASIDTNFMTMPMEVIHDFNPVTTPWTVATKLNYIATMFNGGATTMPAGNVFKPQIHIEYTLERLTADLRDYLAKRLQIQGS